ncbi:hypothetical protein amrb99_02550 [Actinomadura sp. RB99]|uniref:RDD family protein n=1 Tax=Actinomadura sp. RB99 TaxID=2691577 RepID=UPI001685D49D|nr:RDD family protein [Actinomadura sp. RB99]MBD2891352.1 hypothetical protein [Actinomadura sp. RB99]
MRTRANLASGKLRLIAYVVDTVILAVLLWVSFEVFAVPRWDGSCDLEGFAVAAFVLNAVYHCLIPAVSGRTPGKWLAGIKIIRTDFSDIGLGRATWRYVFMLLLGGVTLGIGSLIDAAWLLWDPDAQTLHDKAADTWVVEARDPRMDVHTSANPYSSANPEL